jgi:hypothetical protein
VGNTSLFPLHSAINRFPNRIFRIRRADIQRSLQKFWVFRRRTVRASRQICGPARFEAISNKEEGNNILSMEFMRRPQGESNRSS